MKMLKSNSTKSLMGLTMAMLMGSAQANNISEHVSRTNGDSADGYFKIGIGGAVYKDVFEGGSESSAFVPVEGRYQWKGAFAEISSSSIAVPGLAAGYNVWQNDNWSVDALVTLSAAIDVSEIDRFDNSNLKDRSNALAGGVRVTHFYDDYVFQGHLLTASKRGVVAALAAGRHWQVNNWNFIALASARYNSSKYNDFYFGVDESEVNDDFAAYQAGSGVTFEAELAAEYPLSENWVFEAAVRHAEFSGALKDSPLLVEDRASSLRMSVSYVF